MPTNSLENKIALVTGASRGIGQAAAIALAGEGAHVILLARTLGGLEETDDEIQKLGGTATIVQLDLRDGAKLDALGPTIYSRWQRLDILIANAGVLGALSPLSHIDADTWQDVLAINLSANWRLIRTLDPLLKKSEAGRAVFVSSGAAHHAPAYWGAYAASKAGLEALARSYAAELANTPIRVNIVHPGAVRTEMRARAVPGEDPMTLPTSQEIAPLFIHLARPDLTANGEVFSPQRPPIPGT